MKTTRRSFLKTSVVAPMIIPSALWAAQTKPNDRITVGFIGMGKQSRGLLNGFLYGSQVVAVCDVDTTRREDARKRVDDFYTRYPERKDPQGVKHTMTMRNCWPAMILTPCALRRRTIGMRCPPWRRCGPAKMFIVKNP